MSSSFIVGLLTQGSDIYYGEVIQSAPLFVSPKPVVFFSPPLQSTPNIQEPKVVTVRVHFHKIGFNSVRGDSEMLVFLEESPTMPGLFRSLGIDTSVFVPYFTMCHSPMNSKLTRFWTNSVGNQLQGKDLQVEVMTTSGDQAPSIFNPDAFHALHS